MHTLIWAEPKSKNDTLGARSSFSMQEDPRKQSPSEGCDDSAPATRKPKPRRKTPHKKTTSRAHLPQYRVLLHGGANDHPEHVVMSILKLTSLTVADAEARMLEAYCAGVTLVLVTHRERAELYEEQFRAFKLHVTIEPET